MTWTRRLSFEWRGDVDSRELEALHATAFAEPSSGRDWNLQLRSHSVGWVTARDEHRLIGFVNVAWDGGMHAFLVDSVVIPDWQRQGIGEQLVRRAGEGARDAGCTWLHVDFEPRFQDLYIAKCGFSPTPAGILRLA